MLKHLVLLLLAYLALALELSSWAAEAGIRPAYLYLVACIAGWVLAPGAAAIWGALLGLLADAISPGPIGLEFLLLGTSTGLAARFRLRGEHHSALAFTLTAMLITLAQLLTVGAVEASFDAPSMDPQRFLLRAAGQSAATGLLALALLTFVRAARFGLSEHA